MRLGGYAGGRSATLAYRLSGTAAHRVAEASVRTLEQWSPAARRARRHWKAGRLEEALDTIARIQASGRAMPLEMARGLESDLADENGRARWADAAAQVLERRHDAPIAIYLRLLGLVDEQRFEAAHGLVSSALCRVCDDLRAGLSGSVARERTQTLVGLWKIADSAARDQMRWVVEAHADGAAYAAFDFVRAFEALPVDVRARDHLLTLAFAEPLLQGRRNAAYLERCALAFIQASTLFQRLHVVRAMCRQGFRRIPDYTPAYEQARAFLVRCLPEIDRAIARARRGGPRDPRAYLRTLRLAQSLAAQLSESGLAERLRDEMIECAGRERGRDGMWLVASALAQQGDGGTAFDLVGDAAPRREQDLRDFYQFAMRTDAYKRAHAVFDALPVQSRTRQSAIAYATILQRSQRFEEAERLVRDLHAHLIANVDVLDYFVSYGLIRRAGELRFAAETARHFEAIPQPKTPRGVILVTPRSIEQLRRTPLTVLLEWKRMGWAVVPIYEGVLPLQKTGMSEIDRFAGCIRLTNALRADADAWMSAIEPFDVDIGAGRLGWRGIDLSHALWEEAAINRRVYDVTWSCPALRRSLSSLVGWTQNLARVLETAHQTLPALGLRTGTHVFFNFRLPDALVRFHCATFGDPRDFFCVHASNGYENYFINFQRNLSTRLTIRNMTAHPDLRASSMPLPDHVSSAVSEDRASVGQSLQSLIETVRSKPHGHVADPARDEALGRVAAWKRDGGRVACAFGKVVCDSGVPFDGGPAHRSMKDWINHTVMSAAESRTLLLVKPHPHELREEVACFLNQRFRDLLPETLPENVIYLGHDWFETHELEGLIDVALVYNGTTAVEMALIGIPTVLAGHFGPVDYPLGLEVPVDRDDYRRLVRFERAARPAPDGPLRAAAWLTLMRSDDVSVPYRYHSRQVTNCVVYPPYWFSEDIDAYLAGGDANVRLLAERGVAYAG